MRGRLPNYIVSNKQQIESTRTAKPIEAGSARRNPSALEGRSGAGNMRSRLRFFRMISWFAIYSAAVLFLMSLILFGISHLQTKIFLGAFFVAMALLIATYVYQWRC